MTKPILNAGENTVILFSKNEVVTQLNSMGVQKLSRIFSSLQERAEDMEDEDREMLYGTLVDCFEEEAYFTAKKDTHDVQPRNLQIVQTEGNFGDSTTIAFGYLNSKDCSIEPNELELMKEDLKWFTNESGRCKTETKGFVETLIGDIEDELRLIKQDAKSNEYTYND